ncbi:enolase C-terminal domain-like protein [Seonamhaeicola sp.]|uniref:enolase C-terminal domain-like protein n=1 Tax=Seonamhaeicola sp. TaxID=1912245 RepID=UPI00260498ED|nr:enolase C-terminal domain-like protein [Seonamhaeicola sp.]
MTVLPGLWARSDTRSKQIQELDKHIIDKCELVELNFHWPRFVGKNGRIDFHGQQKKSTALRLYTNKGAIGWGLSHPKATDLFPLLKNKKVTDLILPEIGIVDGLDNRVDFALHDLMGVILNQPVYKLIGGNGTNETPIYSGMIYLDELNPGNETKGIDAILENCQWDVDYGYQQLKVKIGRSGRWYEHDKGLAKDIEVVKLIYHSFKDKGVEVLVDSNDMYTLDGTIKFLEGIGDMPLYWVEEPFREEVEAGKKLKQWMLQNGFENTFYADGESRPDFEVCLGLGKQQLMDVFLPDTYGYGFSKWLKLMPELKRIKMLSSPHAWGNRLKTNYTAQIAAGLGNVCTVEGVTCLSEDIDYGNYPMINGKIKVSDAPGFGMKILKK